MPHCQGPTAGPEGPSLVQSHRDASLSCLSSREAYWLSSAVVETQEEGRPSWCRDRGMASLQPGASAGQLRFLQA